jgi:hypothetical protein
MIRIDRLVFEVPGMTAARAERLSVAIGTMIAGGGAAASAGRLEALLPPGAASDEAILTALAAALRSQVA